MLSFLFTIIVGGVERIRALLGKYMKAYPAASIDVTSCIDTVEKSTASFWRKEGESLDYLLARAAYPDHLRQEYVDFFNHKLTPLFGPSPAEFLTSKPSSFISDDHTPYEFIWTIGRQGNMSVRFALEPLSSLDGSAQSPSRSMAALDIFREMRGFDLTWSNACHQSLSFDPLQRSGLGKELNIKHSTHFFLGGDLEASERAIVGKAYFIPDVRAALDGVTDHALVQRCMSELGVGGCWAIAASYIQSMPESARPTIAMVAVDCLAPSKNRAKVYLRTQSSSFDDIAELLTLGGGISDECVDQTLSTMRHLWALLFPDASTSAPLHSKRAISYPTGFLIYFEMVLGRAIPIPKVYIPVRLYCNDDAQIAAAMSHYFKDIKLEKIGERYKGDLEKIFPHRDPGARTGMFPYIGICTKKASEGPVIYHYMSPEVFAPERNQC